MKVRELIEELERFDGEMECTVYKMESYFPIEQVDTRTATSCRYWFNYDVNGEKIILLS